MRAPLLALAGRPLALAGVGMPVERRVRSVVLRRVRVGSLSQRCGDRRVGHPTTLTLTDVCRKCTPAQNAGSSLSVDTKLDVHSDNSRCRFATSICERL